MNARNPAAPLFSTLEILESRQMLSASGQSATEAVHSHGGHGLHAELEHANKSEVNSGKFRVKTNDDPAGHDANDDHGVDGVGVHQQKGRGKGK